MRGRWSYKWAAAVGAVLAIALILFLGSVEPEVYRPYTSIMRLISYGVAGALWGLAIAWVRNRFVPKVKL